MSLGRMDSLRNALPTTPSETDSCRSSNVYPQTMPAVPTCHLCGQRMSDPVTLIETGETFDAPCLEQWLESNDICPVTGETLQTKATMPNYIMRDIINSGLKDGMPVSIPVTYSTTSLKAGEPGKQDSRRMQTSIDAYGANVHLDSHSSADEYPQRMPYAQDPPPYLEFEPRHTTARGPATQYETVLELLSSNVADLQDEALRVLLSTLRSNPNSHESLVQQGAVLGLIAVLNSGSPQAQSMAVDVLALLLDIGPPSMANNFLDAGVVQSLVGMLLSPSALVQQQAVGLVAMLSTKYAVAVSLCEEGALGPLVQYLQGDNQLAKEYASSALAAIARQEEQLVKHIAETADSVPALAQLLRSGSTICQQNGAFVLGRIAALGGQWLGAVSTNTVISPAVQLLYFGDLLDIKLFTAQLLATLCEESMKNRGMVVSAGAASPLLNMLLAQEPTLQLAAGRLLVYLDQSMHKEVMAAFRQLDKEHQKLVKAQVKVNRLKLKF